MLTNEDGCSQDKSAQTVLLQAYASQYFEEILLMLGHVPSDLLLLFKTNDCLRHLDAVLRTPVQSTKGTVPCRQWYRMVCEVFC